jgi:transcriptional regulator GlxA family with amidase domain
MTMTKRRTIFLVYEGFELLDLAGPSAVMMAANSIACPSRYDVVTASAQGGAVISSAGIVVETRSIGQVRPGLRDTVLACGAERDAVLAACANPEHRRWLQAAAKRSERYGSICTGAFLLAQAGLLAGKRATTHWLACEELAKLTDRTSINPDALYVTDGRLWTSGGATAGIDMALALVARDSGSLWVGEVASRLVMHAHRSGNQSQFSTIVRAQVSSKNAFGEVLHWIDENLHRSVSVGEMAERAGQTERTFYRHFAGAIGKTPATYLIDRRLDRAKQLLASGRNVKEVAVAVGFKSESSFRAAFNSRFDLPPSAFARAARAC